MGWLDKFFGRKASGETGQAVPPQAPIMSSQDSYDDYSPADEARDYIRRDYLGGFYPDDQVIENARDVLLDEMDEEELDRLLPALLAEVKAEHAETQKTWPATTDCDRLDAAFATLEADGIVARQNFSCCGTCASSEIWGEMEAVRDSGGPVRGYAYYHMQDTEAAVEGDGIYLGYGATEEGEGPALKVAQDIVAGLKAHGLQTQWNGSWGQRIGVTLDWKKRR